MIKVNDRNKIIIFIFQIIALLCGITSVILQVASKSIFTDEFMINHMFAYFTIQTNIFSILLFLYLIIKTISTYIKKKEFKISRCNESLELAITFYITITMLGYWCLLVPMSSIPKNPLLFSATLFLHTITPLVTIIYTLLFMEHGKVSYKEVVKWYLYPLIYLVSVIIIAQVITTPYYYIVINGNKIGLTYPYPFIDPKVMGIGGMILAILALVIFFGLFALLYIFIDKKLKRNEA